MQILVKHIQSILPDLRARINAQIVTLQKELVGYGEVTESKVCALLSLVQFWFQLAGPGSTDIICCKSIATIEWKHRRGKYRPL